MKVSILTTIAKNKKVDRIVQWTAKDSGKLNKDNKPITNLQTLKKILPPVAVAWYTGFYIVNTATSKKIPEERKPIFITNHILTGILGIAGGYVLSDGIDRFSKTLINRFEKINTQISEKNIVIKGLNSMVPLFAYVFTVRFLAPIIATPLADKVYNFLVKNNLLKTEQDKK